MIAAAVPSVNCADRPLPGRFGIGRNFSQQKLLSSLIPDHQFCLAVSIDVAEHLIMVLVGAGILDQAPGPADSRIVSGIRVFPPPHLIAAVIPTHDDIQIAVAVNVVIGAAGLDVQYGIVDQIFGPARIRPSVPDHRRTGIAPCGDHKIIDSIAINIENQRCCLLDAPTRCNNVTSFTREVCPT